MTAPNEVQAHDVDFTKPISELWNYTDNEVSYELNYPYWKKADAIVLMNDENATLVKDGVAILKISDYRMEISVTYDDYLLVQNVSESDVHTVKLYDWIDNDLQLLYWYTTSIIEAQAHMTDWIGGNFITYSGYTKLYTPIEPATNPAIEETHEYSDINTNEIGKNYYTDCYDEINETIIVETYNYNNIVGDTGIGLRKIYATNLTVIWESAKNLYNSGNLIEFACDDTYAYCVVRATSSTSKVTAFYLSNGTIAKESETIDGGKGNIYLNSNVDGIGVFCASPVYGLFNTSDCSILWVKGDILAQISDYGILLDNGDVIFSHWSTEDEQSTSLTRYDVNGDEIETLVGTIDIPIMPLLMLVTVDRFYICGSSAEWNQKIIAYENEYVGEGGFTYAWVDNSPSETANKGDSYSYDFNTNDEGNTTYALDTDAVWLDLEQGTGTISGTAVAGTYYVNVTADNGTVELYHNYTLTVAMTLNWVNHSPSESANEGVAYSYTFSVDEDDAVFSLTTDAEWLSINATTGVLSGTTEDGEFYVNVTATLDELSVYENYTLTITNVPIAWVNHSPTASVNEGVAYAYTFTTNKDGELFLLDGNASWLSINATTGVLSGTAQDGVYSVKVSASFDDETIWHNYTLTVANVPVVWLNHAPGATGTNNTTYTYTFTTNKVGEVFDVDTNATWLAINATTGILSGTAEAGIYYVNVTASFDGEVIYHNYTLTISEPAPPTTRQQTFDMLPELTVAVFLILCIGIFVFMLWAMVGRVEKR